MRLLGDDVSRELLLWERGVLDQLPAEVGHVILGGWVEDDTTVVVMRDLGDSIIGSDTRLTASDCRQMLTAIHALHRHHHDQPPADLAPLDAVIDTFAPARVGSAADLHNPVIDRVLRGWSAFEHLIDPALAKDLLSIVHDPAPLADALSRRHQTMCHGDVAAVNIAWISGQLILIDWAQAVAAPGELDIARFLPGGLRSSDLTNDQFLDEYRAIAEKNYDPEAMRLSLLATLVWFGWSKALNATEHPDPIRQTQERLELSWWEHHARNALTSDL